MMLASQMLIARVTGQEPYPSGKFIDADAARVNRAVLAQTGGKMPCYAIPGTRVPYRWVSVGSSVVIPRGNAARWLAQLGANIDSVETA